MHAQKLSTVTEVDYLAGEQQAEERHEFIAGEVFAMTGGSLRHATLGGNIFAALRSHLKGSPCRVFMTDVKVRVARDNAYYYPDVVVTCDARHAELGSDQYVVEAPTLIVEVLSSSTEGVDRREKMFSYRKLASLKEYVLVSQSERKVEVFRRTGDVGWDKLTHDPSDPVELVSVSLVLSMDEIYDDTGL
jgi:Uma2 family endonuclease